MKIYTISDLHLSFGADKPMDVFGKKWENYEEKVSENWKRKVNDEDVVILAGDFSWAMYLEEANKDFEFLNNLPGKKIMLKGNHDYWWETVTKLNNYIELNDFKSISFLHNNCFDIGDYIVCGTKYWQFDENEDNEKIFNRELGRAKISLEKAKKMDSSKKIIMVTHYPPDEKIIELAKNYNVKKWIYGHIHSNYENSLIDIPGIDTYLTSCDYLDFDLLEL